MEMMRLCSLPFLLLVFLLHSLQPHADISVSSPACVNDYINNISCVWNSYGTRPDQACHLHSKKASVSNSCELLPFGGEDPTLRRCNLFFNGQAFIYPDNITIELKCENSTRMRFHYLPRQHVVLHPPGMPVVANTNVSWSRGSPFSVFVRLYKFQLQLKEASKPWEVAVTMNTESQQTWVDLEEDNLMRGVLYQARVRVRPKQLSEGKNIRQLAGEWSSWSAVASWRSEVGGPKDVEKVVGRPTLSDGMHQQAVWVGICIPVALVLLFFLCRSHRAIWASKLWRQHVPDPSAYFESLISLHGGNFQKWLSPMFTQESFDILRHSEDISHVEVSKEKAAATPSFVAYRGLGPSWDSSGQSTFSNLGYFFSGYPGSCQVETCSLYFSYQPGETRAGERKDGRGGVDGGPLLTSSFHNSDSGFGMEKEEQEEEEEAEAAEGGELGDLSPSPPVHLFPLPHRILPALAPSAHPPFLQLATPFPGFDTTRATGYNPATEPLGVAPFRSSSVKIEPSSGGYMSLQDLHVTYCNKSI